MVLRVIRSYLAYAWLMLSLFVFVPLAVLCLPFPRGYRVHDWATVAWMGVTMALGGARVSVSGAENVRPTEHYVIVANHQSILDIPALFVTLQPLTSIRFMAKRIIFWVPVLGWAMYIFGHVPIDRTRARRTLPSLRRAQERLRTRYSFLLFPEGTRTATGKVGSFKSAAFRIAARAGVPVLPITISGALQALPKWTRVISSNALVQVAIHPPIAPTGDSMIAIRHLQERCYQVIEQGLPREQQGIS